MNFYYGDIPEKFTSAPHVSTSLSSRWVREILLENTMKSLKIIFIKIILFGLFLLSEGSPIDWVGDRRK